MKLAISDHEDVAQDEFVVTVRLRVKDEAALMAAANIRALDHGNSFVNNSKYGERRTKISCALAEVLLGGRFENAKIGIEMIAGEINQFRRAEFSCRKDGGFGRAQRSQQNLEPEPEAMPPSMETPEDEPVRAV